MGRLGRWAAGVQQYNFCDCPFANHTLWLLQAAATRLGYDGGAWPTANREWPDWDDLSPEERDSASVLGMDQYTWPPEADDWDAEDLFASAEMDEEEGGSD